MAKLLGDPDWAICAEMAYGVPVGVGVDLPRTPEVFPPKTAWSLPEQESWGGDSEKAQDFRGIERSNYPSAREFKADLRAALDEQVEKGFMLKMSRAEAKER